MIKDCEERLKALKSKSKISKSLRASCSIPTLTKTVQHAFLVATGVREGYLLEGMTSDGESIKGFLEATMSDHQGALAVLELGMDVLILNKRALKTKLMALHGGATWDFTRFPLLIDVDADLPSFCVEANVKEISRILHNALQVNQGLLTTSKESIALCTLLCYEEVQREVSLPLVAGWLIGYPVCYRSVGDGRALSMQQLEKTSLTIQLENSEMSLVVMEFTAPLCLLEGEGKSKLARSLDARVREVAAISIVALTAVEKSVESHPSVIL